MATKWYVEQVLAALRLRQQHPVFIASSDYWSKRFSSAGCPSSG
jgi:hypothetical protein